MFEGEKSHKWPSPQYYFKRLCDFPEAKLARRLVVREHRLGISFSSGCKNYITKMLMRAFRKIRGKFGPN